MKRGFKLLSIVLVLLLCVGCMDMKLSMNINKDKSMDLNIGLNVNLLKMYQSMQEMGFISSELCEAKCDSYDHQSDDYVTCVNTCMSDGNLTDDNIKEYLDQNMTSEDFDISDMFFEEENLEELEKQGYKVNTNVDKENYNYSMNITKHFNNIDDLVTTDNNNVDFNDIFQDNGEISNLFIKNNNTYKANFSINPEAITEDYDIEDYTDFMSYTYEVNLPYAAISSNASTKSNDNKKLSWDLLTNDNISYEFELTSSPLSSLKNISNKNSSYIGFSLIGLGTISLILTTIIFIKKSKQN